MFKKFVVGAVFLLSLSPMFFPLLTSADGMLIAPPDRYVFESDQKGVIFFENGEERLILSTAFRGDTNDFAWIIPSPSKPEVSKASAEIFSSLQSLTGTQMEMPSTGLDAFSIGAANTKGVQIIEQKSIEYYDLAVLSSDDKAALTNWLNTNGYHFPEQYSYVLQSYIDNNWIFTAVKFKNDVNAQVLAAGMKSGNLIPLEFKFKTDKPVYPLKISSVIEEPGTTSKLPLYVDGKIGKAVETTKYKRINTFSVPYNYENGTIEMWIKINQDNSGSKMAINNVSLFSAYDIKNKSNRLIFDIQGNLFKLELMQYDNKINQFATGGTWFAHYDNLEPIKTNEWYYTVVTWQKGVQPKFYLNGVLASEDAFGPVFPELVNNDLLKEIVVGHDYFAGDSKNLNIDQIRLSSVARTDQEITDNYNNGLGNGFSFDEGTILLSNFENNLNYQTRNSSQGVFTYQDNTPIFPGNYNKPSSVGIELYIFTPDKEQTLPGFQTAYAAWTDKKTIQNLALDDNGKPWLEVKKDKYYLTKLSRQMRYEEMNNDLFFRDAATNSDTNTAGRSIMPFYIIISIAVLITLSIVIIIINKINRD